MLKTSIKKWLAVAALLGCSLAMAAEPTLNEIYEAAHAGRMEQAQVMMQQVLVAHPNSGKAHFVQAELSAGQGQLSRAREELATAEKLAPGLPFAKPDAVQKLRAQLAGKGNVGNVAPMTGSTSGNSPAPSFSGGALPASAPASSPLPWGLILALGGGAIAIVIFLIRRKPAAPAYAPSAYSSPAGGGLSGPQSFGMGGGMAPAAYGPGYGQQGYGQQGYGQPQPAPGGGLGGRVMGGLATGLAVGAGVIAAEAIGKSLMGGHDERSGQSSAASNNSGSNYEPIANPGDMGGQNFGVNDGGSWDDGGSSMASSDDGGGGDWDT